MKTIPVAGPSITNLEIDFVNDAIKNCWYSGANKYIKLFESEFATYCNRKYAISLPSCTSGIHLALLALNIGPGDEVIVPDLTWIASAAPIKYVGATTVLADIRLDNLTLDHNKIEKYITSKTKAIIAVNLYGAMPEYNALTQICKEKNIALIEDAAESIGSTYFNKPSGSFGEFSVFSFHGSKTLTTGEGGMLLTDDKSLFERCHILRDHGRTPGDRYFQNNEIAYKYKMTDMQAALGLAQLKRVNELISGKRKIFEFYFNNLKVEYTRISFDSENVFNSYWMSTIMWDLKHYDLDKFTFMKNLSEAGIDSRPIFSPLSTLMAYDCDLSETNNNAYQCLNNGINLPSALNLNDADLEYIVRSVTSILNKSKI